MCKYLFLLILLFFLSQPDLFSQDLNWVPLDNGVATGNCSSTTNCSSGQICFGLQYTPAVSGRATSYTLGFLASCPGSLPDISAGSCSMTDNTNIIDGCNSGAGLFLFQPSGNNGNLPVSAGVPVILHQVCIDLAGGTSIAFVEDDITGLTVSVDLTGGGAETEELNYTTFTADLSSCSEPATCTDSDICTVSFGFEAGQIDLDAAANGNGNLVDGTSRANAAATTYRVDVYDEANLDCSTSGGEDDLTITTRLFNTEDINDNGLIDSLGGLNHFIIQDEGGLTASIPLGSDADSESSSGDIRGYEIEVRFASHIGIRAGQLTVDMEGLNSAAAAFESASLHFLNGRGDPYAVPAYGGYYGSEADLSGECSSTPAGMPWSQTGAGAVTFENTATVDLAAPCNPAAGSSSGSLNPVSAVADAGLAPEAIVSGFVLRVYGEDVATVDVLDDGSATGPDDVFPANHPTNTDVVLISSLLGYTVQGCVFEDFSLPVTWASFHATAANKQARLDWETTEEYNHDYFSVEWSTDNIRFSTIGEVRQAASENESSSAYNFFHPTPAAGTNYYRIRQVDVDGQYSFSEIRSLDFAGGVTDDFTLFPNPATTEVAVTLTAVKQPQVLQLFNAGGQLLRSQVIAPDIQRVALVIDQLPAGLYLVRVGERTRRLLKR